MEESSPFFEAIPAAVGGTIPILNNMSLMINIAIILIILYIIYCLFKKQPKGDDDESSDCEDGDEKSYIEEQVELLEDMQTKYL